MIEQTGESYQSDEYLKALCVSYAKVGKTVKLVSDCLGVFPGQKFGGLVDKPEHLHVITFDEAALGGIQKVLKQSMKAPDAALGFRVYNMEKDVKSLPKNDWDFTFYNSLLTLHRTIDQRIKKEGGVHAVVLSSLTTLGASLKRAIAGDASSASKKSGMDQNKWDTMGMQLNELRIMFQSLSAHIFWEGHVFKPQASGQDEKDGEAKRKESLQLQGSTGQNFPNNVAQIFKMVRMFGERVGPGINVDKVHYHTQAELEFLIGGRSFNELLESKEADMTLMAHKLGCKIGRWGAQKKAAAVARSA